MLRFWVLLLVLATRVCAVDAPPRLIEAGFKRPPDTLPREGYLLNALIARCFVAFTAPASASLTRITAPDGEPLSFVETDEKVPGANRVLRVLRVDPAWKSLRADWQIGPNQGQTFRVAVDSLPPRELSWMSDIYPARTFETPGGGQAMLDHIWPMPGKTQFYFGFRAPADAPGASLKPLQVRVGGNSLPFETKNIRRQIMVEIAGIDDPKLLAPLEFEFAETGFERDPNQISVEIPLPDAGQIAPDAQPQAIVARSQNAVARIYLTSHDGTQAEHAFVSGLTDKPLQKWVARSFTAFQGDPDPKDTWRNQNDSSRLEDGVYFRPDGSLRAPDESYAYLLDGGARYLLEIERRREFRDQHRLRVPLARASEKLEFGADEVGDQTVSVRWARFDPPATPGARGHLIIVLEFVRAFEKSDFKTNFERMQTPWGENWMSPGCSPHWENGHQERGVFQFEADVHLTQLPWVEIAFDHLEAETPDKREEIMAR